MDQDLEIESEDQFWDELDDIVSTPCRTYDRIDDTLRTWLSFSSTYRELYLRHEQAVLKCSAALLFSSLFQKNNDYIRRQLAYSLLQEDEPLQIHLVVGFLLLDGRRNEATFELMNSEGAFPRLIYLIRDAVDDDLGLHRQLVELLYEMSRIQQISWEHLATIDDSFVLYLLQIVEGLSNDVNDPYHNPVIHVLLVLNEQYMVASNDPSAINGIGPPLTNRIIKTISMHGAAYKTFGENLILLLNRESETSLQLLILKLLYLVFTTSSTEEYFYTNDLYVLVDILVRNVLDLPSDNTGAVASLRHTYLRVLHPLLANTQLRFPPHYKRDELRRMLGFLGDAGAGNRHFEQPDDTTLRLVSRCLKVEWIKDEEQDEPSPSSERDENGLSGLRPPPGQVLVAKRAVGLNLSLPEAEKSSLSVAEVAVQKEKPGVLTPSRGRAAAEIETAAVQTQPPRSPFEDA